MTTLLRIRICTSLSAFLLILNGCNLLGGGDSGPSRLHVTARLGEKFKLQEEGVAFIQPDSLHLRFEALLSDSRCPVDVECVWAGAVRIRLSLETPERKLTPFTMHDYPAGEGTGKMMKDTLGYRFTLLRLEPYPGAKNADEYDAPVATLRVDRL